MTHAYHYNDTIVEKQIIYCVFDDIIQLSIAVSSMHIITHL